MNDVNTNRGYSPKLVITVYSDKRNNFYLEQRNVSQINNKAMLMAPIPVAEDVLRDIAKHYAKKSSADMGFGNWIGGHILYGNNEPGNNIVMWYRPAMKRGLNFTSSLVRAAGDTVAHVPATLFVVKNNELYVYALMADIRPELTTKLYSAPFFNIYNDGKVCLGTAPVGKVRQVTFQKEAQRFERGFFMAEQNGGQSGNACKTPLSKLWPQVIKSKSAFPSKAQLKPHGTYKTVGDLIRNLIGNKTVAEHD